MAKGGGVASTEKSPFIFGSLDERVLFSFSRLRRRTSKFYSTGTRSMVSSRFYASHGHQSHTKRPGYPPITNKHEHTILLRSTLAAGPTADILYTYVCPATSLASQIRRTEHASATGCHSHSLAPTIRTVQRSTSWAGPPPRPTSTSLATSFL